VLCAEYLCGYLAEGGEDGVLVRRVSRLAARYTARVAETVIKINAYKLVPGLRVREYLYS
jgi:hypothetical protein